MELYVGKEEGVVFYHVDEQNPSTKVYDMFSYCRSMTETCHTLSDAFFGWHDDDYELYQMKTAMNRMKIKRNHFSPHSYFVDLSYWDQFDIRWHHNDVHSYVDRRIVFKSVPLDTSGTFALQCSNKKYLEWDSEFPRHHDPCTSSGICTHCKYRAEIGSLNPFFIEILSIDWGKPQGDVVENPSVLATDSQNNWSDVEITNTFSISFTDSTTDTTTWKEAWGFEFSTSIATSFKFAGNGVDFTVSTTLTYNGEVGGSDSVTDSTTYDKSATYPCPAKKRCTFKLVGRRLNNAAVPFTATVKKTDGFKTEVWKEKGVWEGIQVYDTYTEYHTEDLEQVMTK